MPFTFARCRDQELARPALQTTIVGALLALGLVPPGRDDAHGALHAAMRDLAWLTWNGTDDGLLFIRRARLWRGMGCGPWLWIGVELRGRSYRIACSPARPEDRPRIRGELAALGVADDGWWRDDAIAFRPRSIRMSRWAAAPSPDGGACHAGRTMARRLPPGPPADWALGA